jgi:hypothetical protein
MHFAKKNLVCELKLEKLNTAMSEKKSILKCESKANCRKDEE